MQFEFWNIEWLGYFNDICIEIGKELGIDVFIRVEFYKMFIYEKGVFFKLYIE